MSEESIKVEIAPLVGPLFTIEVQVNITVQEFYQKINKDFQLETDEKIKLYYFHDDQSKILDEFLNEPLSKNENDYCLEAEITQRQLVQRQYVWVWLRKVVGAIVCDVLHICWNYIESICGKMMHLKMGKKKEMKESGSNLFLEEKKIKNSSEKPKESQTVETRSI